MKSAFLRNFLTLFLFTIGGVATLSAQVNGNENEFYICNFGISPVPCEEDEEIEVCACSICFQKVDCDDINYHMLVHEIEEQFKTTIEEHLKDENGESSGGGGGGGGGKPGSGSNSGSGTGTTVNPGIYSLEKMSSAAKNAIEYVLGLDAEEGTSKDQPRCNQGVAKMFESLTGKKDLNNMRANDMIDYMRSSPEWVKIEKTSDIAASLKSIQDMANKGYFIIASWQNAIPGESGHVSVILPGTSMHESGTYDCYVPYTLDTGPYRRSEKTALSMGYGVDKWNDMEFFYYKP